MDSYLILEKRAEKIAEWIRDVHPDTPTQTEVMQKFRIRKHEILKVEEKLMARRMVVIDPFPNTRGIKGTSIHYHMREEGDWIIEDEILNAEEPRDENYPESVYFAIAPEYNKMKIGWTTGSPQKRVDAVAAGGFARIVLFGSIEDKGRDYEQYLHRRYKEFRVMNEWFTASEIAADVIRLPGFEAQLHLIEVDGG